MAAPPEVVVAPALIHNSPCTTHSHARRQTAMVVALTPKIASPSLHHRSSQDLQQPPWSSNASSSSFILLPPPSPRTNHCPRPVFLRESSDLQPPSSHHAGITIFSQQPQTQPLWCFRRHRVNHRNLRATTHGSQTLMERDKLL